MAHVPAPLPDETAAGYWGRLFILNGESFSTDAATATLRRLSAGNGISCGDASSVELLAALAKLSLGSFLKSHSLLPFFSAVQASGDCEWVAALCKAKHKRSVGIDSNSLLCPECVREDVGFWGVSYWRRIHQVPGINWCPKHGVGLLQSTTRSAPLLLPQALIDNAAPPEKAVLRHALANSTIQRYAEIASAILDFSAPVSTLQMVRCIQGRAHALRMHRDAAGRRVHISELAAHQVAGPWQERYFPDLSRSEPGRYIDSIDRTHSSLKVAYPTKAYALALASLFDSADDALISLASYRQRQIDQQHEAPRKPENPSLALLHAKRDFRAGLSLAQAVLKWSVSSSDLEEAIRQELRSPAQLRID